MGYAHGKKWDDVLIENTIKEVIKKAKINTFPTKTQMQQITGNYALSCAVSKHGGSRYWAEKLGLEMKQSESKFGEEYEFECISRLKHYGFRCEKTPVRYPYDILVENAIKVEVKCGNIYHGKTGDFYTFNLEKAKPTCDIFVCFCLEGERTEKIYVIPSNVLSGNTQLSIGKYKSKYDTFINRWGLFREYDAFYSGLLDENWGC